MSQKKLESQSKKTFLEQHKMKSCHRLGINGHDLNLGKLAILKGGTFEQHNLEEKLDFAPTCVGMVNVNYTNRDFGTQLNKEKPTPRHF